MLAFPDIDPVAFSLGPLQVRWYGLSYLAGLLIAWWLLNRRARRPDSGFSADQVADLVFYSMLGIFIGGRLGSVLFYNFDGFLQAPLMLFKIHQGGMSFHGGLLGALAATFWLAGKIDKPFFVLTDFVAPVVPVGLFLGRIANFVNGELWGRASTLPWAMVFPDPRAGNIARHPSQLYEAGLEGLLLFVILWLFSARPRPVKAVSGLFFLGYGTVRFLVEFVRQPDQHIGYIAFDWLTMGQLLTLPMIIFGAVLLLLAYKKFQ